MNDNQSQSESIFDIVKSVENKTLLLPEFQRDFRWDIERTFDLFDSLIRDIFIGAVIYGKPSFEMTLRYVDDRPRKGKGSQQKIDRIHYSKDRIKKETATKNLRILLDGQQRITSLYRALNGIDPVFFLVAPSFLTTDISKHELLDYMNEIAGDEDGESISVPFSLVYKYHIDALEDEDIDAVFLQTAYAKGMLANASAVKNAKKQFRIVTRKLRDMFNQSKLVSFYLLDMSLERFCIFFERSNSRGVQLNFTDILAAKLYSGFNLRKKIDEFVSDYPHLELNRETIVRTISYITQRDEAIKNISIDKKTILDRLVPDDFHTYWDEVTVLYVSVYEFLLKQHFIMHPKWIPSENMIIPLMVLFKHINGPDRMNEFLRQYVEFWYWASVFANRYSAASNEVIIADSLAMVQIADGKRVDKQGYFSKFRSLISELEDLYSYNKRTSAIYRGVLNLLGYAAEGLKDLKSNQFLDASKPLDDHHIFPRAFLSQQLNGINDESDDITQLVDCVANRTLIPKNLNLKIGKQSPSQYFTTLFAGNKSIEDAMTDHCIPVELLKNTSYDGNYRAFLEKRAGSMFDLIERYAIEPLKEVESTYGAIIDSNLDLQGHSKLATGLRTPEKAFRLPILMVICDSGGSSAMSAVLARLSEHMKAVFTPYDFAPLKSDPKSIRWHNTAQWARNSLVKSGFLSSDSPRGIWAVTKAGQKFYNSNKLS